MFRHEVGLPTKGKKNTETTLASRSGIYFRRAVHLSTVTDLINARGVYLIFGVQVGTFNI